MSLHNLDIEGSKSSKDPRAVQWREALTRPTKFNAAGQALASKRQVAVAKETTSKYAPPRAVTEHKRTSGEKNDWMKALGIGTTAEVLSRVVAPKAEKRLQSNLIAPRQGAVAPQHNQNTHRAMSKDWMQALGFAAKPVTPKSGVAPTTQQGLAQEHKQATLAQTGKVLGSLPTKALPAKGPGMKTTAASVPVQQKPVTGEAILQDWMKALGLSALQSHESRLAPLHSQHDQQGLAKQVHGVAAKKAHEQPLSTVSQPVHVAERENIRGPGQVSTKVKAKGELASWMSALHRQPDSVFGASVFSERGDQQAASVKTESTSEKAAYAAPQSAKHQLLVAKGAKPTSHEAKVAKKPAGGPDMWGDVLVHMKTPLGPDEAMMPSGVARGNPGASSANIDSAAWMKALHRPSEFKGTVSGEMLARKPSEHYSKAIMQEAIAEGETPRAILIEREMKGSMTALEPFSDEQVPAQAAADRTLWGN